MAPGTQEAVVDGASCDGVLFSSSVKEGTPGLFFFKKKDKTKSIKMFHIFHIYLICYFPAQ